MRRILLSLMAGVIMAPAFFFLAPLAAFSFPQGPSTDTLISISQSLWAESRHYDDLPTSEALQVVAEDVAFDAWVAQKARARGFTLNEVEQKIVAQVEGQLTYVSLRKALLSRIEVTEEEVEKLVRERRWNDPIPPRWEVSHIFIDTSQAKTRKEKKALKQRASWLKKQLTSENFKQLARLWSDAPSSTEGGYLGAITFEKADPEFASQIRKTTPGTIGGPYETDSGWNIFYVRSYSPQKQRDFSPELLREMTAKVKADAQAREALKSPETTQRMMQELGITQAPSIKEELTALENFMLARRFIREQADATTPTLEQLQAIYQEKKEDFVYPPCRKAREILLASKDWSMARTPEAWRARRTVRDRARELRERILKGEDFATMASKYSASKTAPQGGELCWIQEPSSPLVDLNLGTLEIGGVSPPIATNQGYLLLQLEDVILKKPMAFEEVRKRCESIWNYRQLKAVEEKLRAQFAGENSSPRTQ